LCDCLGVLPPEIGAQLCDVLSRCSLISFNCSRRAAS
jgi:hypothetical protein